MVVAGDGPEMARVRAQAGPNIEILGHLSFEDMRRDMQTRVCFAVTAP